MVDLSCAGCNEVLSSVTLACPSCHRLVHAGRLEELSQAARASEATDPSESLRLWREALALLPPDSRQAKAIQSHTVELGATIRVNATPAVAQQPSWGKRLGPFAAVGALAWKFKALLLLAITKAKFLVLGLTKANTLFSMLATMGVYWTWFGWRFAVGFILGIYVHEMGHVWALRRFGLRASAPMFIPGFGAFVSLYDSPADVHEDARIGLAGPIWGAAAGLAFAAVGLATGSTLWLAVARATASINLFNLIPVWQLDGGRGFRALDRSQRMMLTGLFALLWAVTGEPFFVLMLVGAAYRIFWQKDHSTQPDASVLLQFAALAAVFSVLLAAIPIRQ